MIKLTLPFACYELRSQWDCITASLERGTPRGVLDRKLPKFNDLEQNQGCYTRAELGCFRLGFSDDETAAVRDGESLF